MISAYGSRLHKRGDVEQLKEQVSLRNNQMGVMLKVLQEEIPASQLMIILKRIRSETPSNQPSQLWLLNIAQFYTKTNLYVFFQRRPNQN